MLTQDYLLKIDCIRPHAFLKMWDRIYFEIHTPESGFGICKLCNTSRAMTSHADPKQNPAITSEG